MKLSLVAAATLSTLASALVVPAFAAEKASSAQQDSSTAKTTASASNNQNKIETIEVKGELLKTPASKAANSLQVLTAETLEKSGASHLESVLQQLGNVNFSSGASRARFIQIRGIGERSQFVDPINPSVGMSIDGIDYSGIGTAAGLFDIEQVEVFKGPQGTNAGANAMAGFVNMVSTQPSAGAMNKLRVEAGNYGLLNLGVAAGTDFTSTSSARVAISKVTADGYIENTHLNRDDTNNIDELSVRALFDVEFNKDTSAQFVLHHFDIDNGYDAFSLDLDRTTLSDNPGKDTQDTTAFGVNTEYTGLDTVDIKLSASTSSSDMTYGYDEDWAYEGIHPWEYSSTDYYFRDRDAKQFDVRAMDKDGSWVTGLYIQQRDVDLTRDYTYADGLFSSEYQQDNIAVYGERRMALSKQLTVSAGVRVENHTGDYSDNNGVVDEASKTMIGGHLTATNQYSKAAMAYVRLSRGFKSGGVNGEALARVGEEGLERFSQDLLNNGTFEPEVLNNVELGMRYNNRKSGLNANAVLFYSSRSDMQVKQWFTNDQEVLAQGEQPVFVGYISNAPTGSNYGVETSLQYQVTPTVELLAGVSWLSSEINDIYRLESDPETGEDIRVSIDGREQAHAPSYQYQLGANWQLADRIKLHATVNGRDGYLYSISHDEEADSVALVNLALTYQGDFYDVTLWTRNLTDETYGVRGFYFGNDPRDFYTAKKYEQFGEPNVFGVRVDVLF